MRKHQNEQNLSELAYVVTPEMLVGSENSMLEALREKEGVVRDEKTFTTLLEDANRGSVEIFGQLFVETYSNTSEISAEQKVESFKTKLQKEFRLTPSELNLLSYYNQLLNSFLDKLLRAGITAIYRKNEDGTSSLEVSAKIESSNKSAIYRGEDGHLYCEINYWNMKFSWPNLRGETTFTPLPGTAKAIFRFTPDGPEFVRAETSNTLLRSMMFSNQGITVDKAAIEAAKTEENFNQDPSIRPATEPEAFYTFSSPESEDVKQAEENRYQEATGEILRRRWGFPGLPLPEFTSDEISMFGNYYQSAKPKVDAYFQTFLKTLPKAYREKYGDESIINWILDCASEAELASIPSEINALLHINTSRQLAYSLAKKPQLGEALAPIQIGYNEATGQLYAESRLVYSIVDLINSDQDHPIPGLFASIMQRADAVEKEGQLAVRYTGSFTHNLKPLDAIESGLVEALNGIDWKPANVPAQLAQDESTATSKHATVINGQIDATYDTQATKKIGKKREDETPEQWHARYVAKLDQERRHEWITKLSEPLFTLIGTGPYKKKLGLYPEVCDLLNYSEKFTQAYLNVLNPIRNFLDKFASREKEELISDTEWKALIYNLDDRVLVAIQTLRKELLKKITQDGTSSEDLFDTFLTVVKAVNKGEAAHHAPDVAYRLAVGEAWKSDLTEEEQKKVLKTVVENELSQVKKNGRVFTTPTMNDDGRQEAAPSFQGSTSRPSRP